MPVTPDDVLAALAEPTHRVELSRVVVGVVEGAPVSTLVEWANAAVEPFSLFRLDRDNATDEEFEAEMVARASDVARSIIAACARDNPHEAMSDALGDASPRMLADFAQAFLHSKGQTGS